MKFNKHYIQHFRLVVIIIFVTSILIISSTGLSFAKKYDENKKNDKDLEKDISVSSIEKNKKTLNDDLKEPNIENDIIKGRYPDQFFVCGYPQQIVEDYDFFEKFDCN